jgi:hypothetical protein
MTFGRAFFAVSLGTSLTAFAALSACGDTAIVPEQVDSGTLSVACTSTSCECPEGRTCIMTCPKGQACNAQCGKGATCDIDCAQSTDCSARCLDNAKGTVRRQTGNSPTVTSAPTGDCKVCLGECKK